MKITSKSSKSTARIARMLADEIARTPSLVVLGLVGDLGAGKTTFIKGLVKGLGVRGRITSPTFIIMRKFRGGKRNIYHIDAYRVGCSDLIKLGFKKMLKSPNIIVVEWADKVRGILPPGTIWIKLEHGKYENERQLTFNRR